MPNLLRQFILFVAAAIDRTLKKDRLPSIHEVILLLISNSTCFPFMRKGNAKDFRRSSRKQ
jgi:hypothetical protein